MIMSTTLVALGAIIALADDAPPWAVVFGIVAAWLGVAYLIRKEA